MPALYPVRYAYDAANRTVAITYPDGSVAGRSYSDRNELAGVSYQGAGVASRHYDASGRLTTTTFGNGQTESRSYLSGSYLPAQVRTAAPTGAAATAFAYRYDAAERKLAEDDLTAPNASQAFAYDAAGRLVDWKRGATATQTWNLSLVGDWNSTTRDGVIEPRQNTWVHEAVRVGTSQLAYDAKGNLTRDEAGQIYAWDPENRLALAANLPGASTAWGIANYSYDALGRRVSKLVDGRRIDYAPAGAQVVQTVDVRAPVASVLEVASDGSAIAPYQTPRGGGILSSLPGRPVVRVNFQPATEQIPTGYLADKGRPLAWRTNGRRYGWSADTAGTARVRGMVADAAWDTNIEVGAQTWKIALPNGSYPVAIVAGDAGFTDSTNNLQVNGLALNDPDPATSQPGYTKGDFDGWLVQVIVTDGYLTIAAGAGAVQPKLCLIEVGARGASISTVARDRLSTQVLQLTDQTAGSGIPPQQGVKKTYIYGSYVDEVLAFQTTSGIVTQRFYPHANHLYSVAALTNAAGQVVERFRFDAYGKQTITSPTGAVRAKSVVGWDRGFTGYVADNETGLMYARSRMYSPTLGRFISRDQLDYVDGYSLYGGFFIPNGVDPFGEDWHHPHPLYLGGEDAEPLIDLGKDAHDAAGKYFRDNGFPPTDEGRSNWKELTDDERGKHIEESLKKAGVDPEQAKDLADKTKKGLRPGHKTPRNGRAQRLAIKIGKRMGKKAYVAFLRWSPGINWAMYAWDAYDLSMAAYELYSDPPFHPDPPEVPLVPAIDEEWKKWDSNSNGELDPCEAAKRLYDKGAGAQSGGR